MLASFSQSEEVFYRRPVTIDVDWDIKQQTISKSKYEQLLSDTIDMRQYMNSTGQGSMCLAQGHSTVSLNGVTRLCP